MVKKKIFCQKDVEMAGQNEPDVSWCFIMNLQNEKKIWILLFRDASSFTQNSFSFVVDHIDGCFFIIWLWTLNFFLFVISQANMKAVRQYVLVKMNLTKPSHVLYFLWAWFIITIKCWRMRPTDLVIIIFSLAQMYQKICS